jgi:protoheme ferro-lyase
MDKEERIDKKFNNLIENMTNKQFFKYVNSWYDEQNYLDIMKEWDTETKEEAIKEIENILRE